MFTNLKARKFGRYYLRIWRHTDVRLGLGEGKVVMIIIECENKMLVRILNVGKCLYIVARFYGFVGWENFFCDGSERFTFGKAICKVM